MKRPAVYMLASKINGTLYIGVTSNLPQRVWQHKNGVIQGFTNTYKVHHLVYYELHETMLGAITREKLLKKLGRAQKISLIERNNREWRDLFEEIL